MYTLNQDQTPLLEGMQKYANQDIAAFYVPGHKRGKGVPILTDYFGEKLLELDASSIPALDNVGNPTGIIKEAQDLFADAFGADIAFFMANGSTSAVHAMLLSVLSPEDKILMPKTTHKSALNGLILCGAMPVYLKSVFCKKDGLTKNVEVDEVRNKLDANPDARAVFILNPTYFGFTSDLKQIAKLCHERGVLLLTDEAHGTHFPFHQEMPESAMASGADMSCISVHKTGGALTQASALLVKTDRLDINRVKKAVNILQSTSASYILMGSLDGARHNLVKNGATQLGKALTLSKKAQQELSKITGISVVSEENFYDPTKLIINVSGLSITGFQVYELLRCEYDIQPELCETNHILAIISLGDCEKWINRLVQAVAEIAKKYASNIQKENFLEQHPEQDTIVDMSPRDSYFSSKELVLLQAAIDRISGESILAYPPGIPIISPGELITAEVIHTLQDLKAKNAFIVDNTDPDLEKILVVKHE